MFIAIVGARSSGKGSVKEYLINVKQFTLVRLIKAVSPRNPCWNEHR